MEVEAQEKQTEKKERKVAHSAVRKKKKVEGGQSVGSGRK